MHCASCKMNIENALKKNDFVKSVSVNYGSEMMTVSFDENHLRNEDVLKIVKSAGDYEVRINEDDGSAHDKHKREKGFALERMKKNITYIAIAVIPFVIEMMLMVIGKVIENDMTLMRLGEVVRYDIFGVSWIEFLQIVLSGLILFVGGRSFYVNAFAATKKLTSNMDTLVVLGATTAWTYSTFVTFFISEGGMMYPVFFEAAVFIVFFILLGRFFEERARSATQKSVEGLYAIQSKFATVIRNDKEIEVPIDHVVEGDRVVVKPGQKVPVDGVIKTGNTSIDESMISGEAMPVEKTVEDKVIGGTLNTTGYIILEVTNTGNNTMLAQIIKMVEEAQGSSVPIQKLADKISRIFVPIVIIIAIITFIFWLFFAPGLGLIESSEAFAFAMYVSISVLVIACPCALGLATPTAIVVSIGHAARKGVLIKNAQIIENAHKIKYIIFDKTGTITEGKPSVSDVVYFEDEVLCSEYALAIEIKTEHPVAHAIVEYVLKNNKTTKKRALKNFHNLEGIGVVGIVDGKEIVMSKLSAASEYTEFSREQKNVIKDFVTKSYTISILIVDGNVCAIYGISDQVKKTSAIAIASLKQKNIHTIMVTGDHEDIAQKVATQVGIERVVSDAVPLDKDRIVQEIKECAETNEMVAVSGDGINDAPALARADIGIAMGTGSDIAIESGDIVIVKGSLQKIVDMIDLSKKTIRIIKQNLFWAFGYNVLAIPIAFGLLYPLFGIVLSPVIAAAAMAFSSVSVVLNSLRLRSTKKRKINII